MAFTEDLSIFYNSDDFAVSATYTAPGGSHPTDGTTVKVIMDRGFIDSNGFESYRPVARCAESDVSDAADGAQIRIPINSVDTDFTIRDVRPNGIGDVFLVLEAQ